MASVYDFFFLQDDEMRQGYVNNHWIPFVRTDPDNRCAAMLVFGSKATLTLTNISSKLESHSLANLIIK